MRNVWPVLKIGVALSVMLVVAGCPKPPKKALSDAEKAVLDARGVSDCATNKYETAERLLEEARELSEKKEYDKAERKAKAAQKLAKEAKQEGEANWEDCQKQKELEKQARGEEEPEDEKDTDQTEQVDEELTLETVHFAYDSSELTDRARGILEENARWIRRNDGKTVVLEGHTDERGTPEYNLALGERRARVVRQYLIQLGIDSSRLSILSYGEEKPAAYGTSAADFQKNRRVEFVPRN